MLKLRMMGTKEEIESFERFLQDEQTAYNVDTISGLYRNKGTEINRRMYAELSRIEQEKESEK